MLIEGTIHSDRGFYFGDVCYVLFPNVYENVFGANDYKEGIYEYMGYSFAVGYTAEGDGYYLDEEFEGYPVDAGNLGLVPLELCRNLEEYPGRICPCNGEAEFAFEDGVFHICFPDDTEVTVDTREEVGEDG